MFLMAPENITSVVVGHYAHKLLSIGYNSVASTIEKNKQQKVGQSISD